MCILLSDDNCQILNVKPTSKVQLPEGSRICAYWSQKFSCLYPGTVRSLGEGLGYDGDTDENTVHIEFDDGDNGTIPLTHISMLPPGYKIQGKDELFSLSFCIMIFLILQSSADILFTELNLLNIVFELFLGFKQSFSDA